MGLFSSKSSAVSSSTSVETNTATTATNTVPQSDISGTALGSVSAQGSSLSIRLGDQGAIAAGRDLFDKALELTARSLDSIDRVYSDSLGAVVQQAERSDNRMRDFAETLAAPDDGASAALLERGLVAVVLLVGLAVWSSK